MIRPRRFARPLLAAAVAVLLLVPGVASAQTNAPSPPASPAREILIIHSYQTDYVWTREVAAGLKTVLDTSPTPLFQHIEHMGSKYLYDPAIERGFIELFGAKYKDRPIELVITSDENAFHFMRAKRDELFPGVPVVFCGVNDFSPAMLDGLSGFTGVVEDNDMARNLELARAFHPGLKNVYVIGDETITMRLVKDHLRALIPALPGGLSFIFLPDDPLQTLLAKVKTLPPDSIIYYLALHKDNQGGVYNAETALEKLAQAATVPIYGNWTFFLGHGLVGGLLCDGFEQGRVAGEMALAILAGARPESIPVVLDSPNIYSFDHAALNRFGIDRAKLPEKHTVVNEPDPFYRLEKQAFWMLIASLVILSLYTVLLTYGIIKRRRVESALRQSEHELRGAEEKYRSIFENSAVGVFRSTLDGRYLDANPAMASMLGYASPAELIDSVKDLFAELYVDPEKAVENRPLIRDSQGPLHFVNRYRRKDGRIITANVSLRPVRGPGGQVESVEGFMEDITEKTELERALLQAQKMEAIGTLAGGVAHDFNNILTSVINSIDLALTGGSPEQTRRDLTRALTASRRGADLVKRILTFSRAEKEEFRPVGLVRLLRETMSMLEASLPRNIRVSLDIRADDAPILGDATRIQQVILNLCANAFQAMRATGGELRIVLAKEDAQALPPSLPPGDYVRIEVRDTGPGIDPQDADKIFDPFFTTKPKGEGTGLGLSVAHGVIKAHGGLISLDQDCQTGARFIIRLPLAQAAHPDEDAESPAEAEPGGAILYIEDDADQIFAIPRVMEGLGYSVIAQRDPMEALAIFSNQPEYFTAVVTDFDMPGKNGVELARDVLALAPGMPVVLATGRRAEAEAAMGELARLALLAKPFNREDLARALAEAARLAGQTPGEGI